MCAPTPRASGKLLTWWCSARPAPTASRCRREPGSGPDGGEVVLTLLHHPTGESAQRHCDWVVCAVHQAPEETLWQQLQAAPFEVHRIGDCVTPRRAHAAVIEGHRVAVAI